MAEVPEHLLKRSQERRKALGLPVEGDDGDDRARRRPTPRADAASDRAAPEAPRRGASDAGDAITEDNGGVPAHLLERSRKRKAALAGGGGGERRGRGRGGGAADRAAATAVAAPAPTGTGPGGHTQRLLTVVKSGSIQQTRAEAQDKVHVVAAPARRSSSRRSCR